MSVHTSEAAEVNFSDARHVPNSSAPASPPPVRLQLGFGLDFAALYHTHGLLQLDQQFLSWLRKQDALLAEQLVTARAAAHGLPVKEESALLIALGPWLDLFIAQLFGIQNAWQHLVDEHHELAPLYVCKRVFIQKRVALKIKAAEASEIDGAACRKLLTRWLPESFSDVDFARQINAWLEDEAQWAEPLAIALQYAAWVLYTPAGKALHPHSVLFKVPAKLNFEHLVAVEPQQISGVSVHTLNPHHYRARDGFALTDQGTDLAGALDQSNYCIWCHHQEKDSCSKGMREKKTAESPLAPFKKNQFGITLAGCPLEEKISEFHELKTQGLPIAALAAITVDNPMAAGTGHRICNDCMKSCIYQKQEPVNIPQSETRTLKDVLELPWGFEIYSLLTRWNPLNVKRPYPKLPTGKRVLVVGMGPAGYTLSHHLMNDGHTVVGVDGLKIEPLDADVCGVDALGKRVAFDPIFDIKTIQESLDERVLAGFGGVAEYGITVRWDKNFLKVIRLLLERREQFALIGGVRFGGTLTVDDAFAAGFDHIALAAGAGRPTVLDLPNGLARGVRTASDFLMGLQLTGAAKQDSIANLQIRLPVVVIGGGLTAIDTATESLAYYVVQVEKFLSRFEQLASESSAADVESRFTEEEKQLAHECMAHAHAIRGERTQAKNEKRAPNFIPLLQAWGGATIAYRKRLVDSPAYTLNHEEVEKALEEGIYFAEGLTPKSIETNPWGAACALVCEHKFLNAEEVWEFSAEQRLPAHTILIAAGTQPNTVLAREDSAHFQLHGRYFQAIDSNGNPVQPERAMAKPQDIHVLLHRQADGRAISFFGDLHPSYFGNVVKAMASAKQGYPIVSSVLENIPPASGARDCEFIAERNNQLRAVVHKIERLTPTIVEVVIRAPLAAQRFEPGQFYRLQNFEKYARKTLRTTLAMEGLALTGAWVDKEQGLLSTIVLEMGGSADLCAHLVVGEPVILMGPTGTPTEIPTDETVMLVGGGLGNAVLFSIGAALRKNNCKVLYFAGYKKMIDRYKVSEIENAADVVIWCSDEAPGFIANRPQDSSMVGNIVEAIQHYAQHTSPSIPLHTVDRIIAIGSDRMMAAVGSARHTVLKSYLKPSHIAIGSINSPMQCMMKEICAQCLQPQRDPDTGEVRYVFSCYNQDQLLDWVDFPGLHARLTQNSLLEKLTAQWIQREITEMY